MKYTPTKKDRAIVYANRIMAGLVLGTSLATGYGCATVKHDASRFGYNLVKVVDGGARFGTGASVGEKAGIYSSDPNAPNYKASETYTGNNIRDRIGYTLMTPVLAARQIRSGIGGMAGSFYDVALGQFIPKNNNLGIVADELTNPEKREGVPIISRGLDYAEEKVGHVNVDSSKKSQLEERLNTPGEKISGSLPLIHPLGDNSLSWLQRITRPFGNALYWGLSWLAGGKIDSGNSSNEVNGGSGGLGGSGFNPGPAEPGGQ